MTGVFARSAYVLLGVCAALVSEARPFTNDIAIPSRLYMLKGVRNEIFVKPLIKRWRPYDDFVRFDTKNGRNAFLRRLSTVATVTNPVEGATLDVSLVNGDEFETVKRISPLLRVAEPGLGSKEVCAQIVGDSFTHGAFFRWALLESGYVPNVRLVGLCRCAANQHAEGRGGWRLESYFRIPKGERYSYHGFMHPTDGRYWGDRSFWRMAWRCVRKTQPKGFEPTYSCARFDDFVGRFDEKTGVLLDPQEGDVQFDPELKSMVRYDGRTWRTADEKSMTWAFDYGKYLEMWRIGKPAFLFEVLGLNDFGGGTLKDDFEPFAEKLRIFKESYLKAVPDGKFVICTPCSSCGRDDNLAGGFQTYTNARMWRFRDWLIGKFDNREEEGWHLLDVSVATDNDYGFAIHDEKDDPAVTLPYVQYRDRAGERLYVQSGTPHPYKSYPAMGVPIAAFVQYWRDRSNDVPR